MPLAPSFLLRDGAVSRIVLPGPLREAAGGRRTLEVQATTVREALDRLAADLPALERRIRDERGAVREHVQLFVGPTDIRDAEGLDTPLPEDAELSVVPAISGGGRRSRPASMP
jgi:sulfur-carrier protein